MFPLFEFSSRRNGRPLIFLITRIHLCKSLPASQSHLNDDLIFCYRVWHKLAGEREEFIGLELSLVRTNSAQRTVYFLHSVYLHKRSLTFIKDWTRCQTQSTGLKLDLFEKPILINTWSSTFESLTVLQIYFLVYRSYTWIIDIRIQTSVWLAGGLKGSKSRLHGNTGHQPSTYVQPQQLQIKR